MAPEPVTEKRNSHRVALISDGGELEQRIAMTLPDAGLEVELSEAPPPDDSEEEAPAAVVAAVSGTAASTAAKIKRLRRRIRDVPLVVVIPSGRSQAGGPCRYQRRGGRSGAREQISRPRLPRRSPLPLGGQVAFPETLLQAPKQPSFTRREKQALGMMVLGFTNQEIGARLGLAETTIKSHLSFGVREARSLVPGGGLGALPRRCERCRPRCACDRARRRAPRSNLVTPATRHAAVERPDSRQARCPEAIAHRRLGGGFAEAAPSGDHAGSATARSDSEASTLARGRAATRAAASARPRPTHTSARASPAVVSALGARTVATPLAGPPASRRR